jgi:uncharacterized membrane protein
MRRFSKSEVLRAGWSTVSNNFGFLLGVTGISFLIMLAAQLAGMTHGATSVLFHVIYYLIDGLIIMGMIKIALKLIDGHEAAVGDLFSCLPQLLSYVGSSLLYSLIIIVGFVLLIVPGIILGLIFMFFAYGIVDKNDGPIEALKRSARITAGVKWDLFLLMLMLLGINFLGMLALLVGLLATVPFSIIVMAFVYRKLTAETEGDDVSPEVDPHTPKLIS